MKTALPGDSTVLDQFPTTSFKFVPYSCEMEKK